MPFDGQTLIGGQWLLAQPSPTLVPEQIGDRRARDQMGMQDRLHDVLEPRPLLDDLVARAAWRRRARVFASASHTSGKKPLAYSCASTAASMRSVLILALAISWTSLGLAITTRPT
jgi:hypothetical protein